MSLCTVICGQVGEHSLAKMLQDGSHSFLVWLKSLLSRLGRKSAGRDSTTGGQVWSIVKTVLSTIASLSWSAHYHTLQSIFWLWNKYRDGNIGQVISDILFNRKVPLHKRCGNCSVCMARTRHQINLLLEVIKIAPLPKVRDHQTSFACTA